MMTLRLIGRQSFHAVAIKAQSERKYLSFVMFDANLTINQLRNAHHDVKLEEDRHLAPLYGQERLL